jgi:hypothetical protein
MTENLIEDPLIPAAQARKAWGIKSLATEWRWIQRSLIPPPEKINNRNYYRQSVVNRGPKRQVTGV